MDWSNERYVRIYVRETVGDVAMSWQARAIWKEILSKCDRAGLISLDGHGVRGLAGLIRIPCDVVEEHFQQLIDDGRVKMSGAYLIVPNFIEAQESTQSDRQRAAESRARRREKAILGEVLSQNETICHKTNPGVTVSHSVSHDVTPCRATPNRTVLKKNKKSRDAYEPSDKIKAITDRYLEIFNRTFNRRSGALTQTARRIEERLNEGIFKEWQILCAPILQKAYNPKTKETRNFAPEMILRDGKNKRTNSQGVTNGATDWLERVYGVADTLKLDRELTEIARYFDLIDDIRRTGCEVTELNNDTATR